MESPGETPGISPPGQMHTAQELVRRALIEPGRLDEIKRDPVTALQNLAEAVVRDTPPRPLESDVMVYRLVVGALGSVVVLSVLGVIVLAGLTRAVPETLTALGSAAIGCLGGILAPSPRQR
mgnify:CR=1 FL=1